MGRTGAVSVPGAMLAASLCIALVFLLLGSAGAQETGDDPLDGLDATLQDTDNDQNVDRISIPVAGCEIDDGATVRVRDADGTRITLIDERNVDIEATQNRVTIQGANPNGDIEGSTQNPNDSNGDFGGPDATADGEVLNSSGITCRRDADSNNAEDDNNAESGANEDNARTADELRNLSCEELLVLFRAGGSSGQGQYGDAVALADADVQARIEVCLEQEIVQDTAAGKDLPNTGGVSLVGLAVLGIVSAAAGLSMIRAGRREG